MLIFRLLQMLSIGNFSASVLVYDVKTVYFRNEATVRFSTYCLALNE